MEQPSFGKTGRRWLYYLPNKIINLWFWENCIKKITTPSAVLDFHIKLLRKSTKSNFVFTTLHFSQSSVNTNNSISILSASLLLCVDLHKAYFPYITCLGGSTSTLWPKVLAKRKKLVKNKRLWKKILIARSESWPKIAFFFLLRWARCTTTHTTCFLISFVCVVQIGPFHLA